MLHCKGIWTKRLILTIDSKTCGTMRQGVTYSAYYLSAQDRFAEDHGQKPTVDPRQDWTLLSGTETAQYTILKFRRNLIACDERDRTIGVG